LDGKLASVEHDMSHILDCRDAVIPRLRGLLRLDFTFSLVPLAPERDLNQGCHTESATRSSSDRNLISSGPPLVVVEILKTWNFVMDMLRPAARFEVFFFGRCIV
jgi:hypothetical protein